MGGDDGQSASPRSDRLGHPVKEALILVEGELVNFDMTAFAGKSIGVGGKAVNAPAIGELEDVGGESVFGIKVEVTEIGDGEVEDCCPVLAIFEIEFGLELVAGTDPDVEFGIGGAGFEDRVESVGFGDADLASLLHDFERPGVINPGGLGGQEPSILEKGGFARDRSR